MPEGRVCASGLGPVFALERQIASRRWQTYALRSLFVCGLLAALIVVSMHHPGTPASILGRLGENLFYGLVGTQLTLVLLAAPAATAGAICLDRARGTLTHLLMTDLSSAEIVLGKLAARLGPVLGLVACALPVSILTSLLGGIDPTALIGAFLVTVGVALLGCALALLFSLHVGRTHEALLGTYALWILWLLVRPISWQLGYYGLSLSLPDDPYGLAFAPTSGPEPPRCSTTWSSWAPRPRWRSCSWRSPCGGCGRS